MDSKDLKIQALLERISSLTTEYENKVADLRVELTLKAHNLDEVAAELERLQTPIDEYVESHNVFEQEDAEDDK